MIKKIIKNMSSEKNIIKNQMKQLIMKIKTNENINLLENKLLNESEKENDKKKQKIILKIF